MKQFIIIFILLIYYANCQTCSRPKQWCEGNLTRTYFWDGQHCEYCGQNCNCDSYMGCNSCPSGYSQYGGDPSKGNYCENCLYSFVNTCCFEVNKNGIRATSCTSSAQLYVSICYSISNCKTYTDYGTCIACDQGYYLNPSGLCTQCTSETDATGSRCKECGGPSSCRLCTDGYYLLEYKSPSDGSPEPKSFAQASRCEQCLNAENSATKTEFCSCTSSNPQCQRCFVGNYYYAKTQMICLPCNEKNPNCIACNGVEKEGDTPYCTACQKNCAGDTYIQYVDSTDNIGKCIQCSDRNCFNCQYNSTTKKAVCQPDGCKPGYFFKASDGESDPSCQSCTTLDPNATRCEPNGVITQCTQEVPPTYNAPQNTAYYVIQRSDGGYTCSQNINNCRRMIPKPTTEQQQKCESCYPQWHLVYTNICKKCEIQYCLECKTNAGSEDLSCVRCINNINKTTWAETAKLNYYVDAGRCSQCSEGCLTCTNNSACNQCQAGYLLKDNACSKCNVENCSVCNAGTDTCDSCWSGFQRYQDSSDKKYKCQVCDTRCARCDNNRKWCDQCAAGYYNDNGRCILNTTNCVNHNGNGWCTNCEYGYRVVDGRCRACFSSNIGFVNCQSGCSSQRYMRDGLTLTKEFNDKKNSGNDKPSYSHILIFNIVAVIFALLTFI